MAAQWSHLLDELGCTRDDVLELGLRDGLVVVHIRLLEHLIANDLDLVLIEFVASERNHHLLNVVLGDQRVSVEVCSIRTNQ